MIDTHATITGITKSGKGAICKLHILPPYRAAGYKVAVLDPLRDVWPADYVTDDPHAFCDVLDKSRNVVAVVDEVSQFRKDPKVCARLERLAALGRHWGHICFFLAQRVMMIPPNIRDNCASAVVLRQPMPSLQILADQYDEPEILSAASFGKGIALIVRPFEKPVKVRVF